MKFILLALLILAASPLAAAKLYRWVDDEGNVHYSDKVPPEHARKERSRLSERGLEVERQGKARSAEEIAREKQVEQLRKKQQKLREEQQARDRVLLRTFRTEEDLTMTRDGKLASVDAQIQLTHNNIKRLKVRLAGMQADAADRERSGERISEKQKKFIEETRGQIEEQYASILRREQQKEEIKKRFNGDLVRLRQLRNLAVTQSDDQTEEGVDQEGLVETLITCQQAGNCDSIWTQAIDFAKQHATTPVQLTGDRIFMTTPAKSNEDISITVSRIAGKEEGEEQIFLDLQCRGNALGREFCRSEKVRDIQRAFRKAVGH